MGPFSLSQLTPASSWIMHRPDASTSCSLPTKEVQNISSHWSGWRDSRCCATVPLRYGFASPCRLAHLILSEHAARFIRHRRRSLCVPSRVLALHRGKEHSFLLVGVEGLEPPAPCSQSTYATKLRYTPKHALSFATLYNILYIDKIVNRKTTKRMVCAAFQKSRRKRQCMRAIYAKMIWRLLYNVKLSASASQP